MVQVSLARAPVRRVCQRGCVALVALSLAANSSAAFSTIPPGELIADTQIAELDRLRMFASDVRSTLDRSLFDLEALLDTLDYDSDRIIDFVRNDIAFEQYPGILRGASGTLVSRSGNALDQALLLAKLLKDAGYDARIARGNLDDEQGTALLKEMQRAIRPAPLLGDPEAAFEVYVHHGVLQRDNRTAKEALVDLFQPAHDRPAAIQAETIEIAAFIKKHLAERGVQPGNADLDRALLDEARDYFWVQFREAASGGWQDLHPAFSEEAEPAALPFATVYGDALPDELQHRLRIRLFAERWRDGRLEVFPVSDAWERPVANLQHKPITTGVIPNTLLELGNSSPDLDRAISEARFFVPVLMDRIAPGAVFFDRYGNQLDTMAAQNPAAGLFGSLQDIFGDAIGKLDPEKSLPSVTAQWVELTLVAPGGHEQVHRRFVFDRIGAAARTEGRVPAAMPQATPGELRTLLERQTVMVNAGNTSRALAMDQSLADMIGSIAVVQMMTRTLYEEGKLVVPENAGSISSAWSGQMTLFASLDEATRIAASHRIYRSAPAVVIHRTALLPGEGVAEGIDIVTNPRRAISLEGAPRLDPVVLIDAGVWETQMEGTVVNQEGPLLNTMLAFEQARAKRFGFKLLLPGQSTEEITVSADSRQHILRDLEQGFAVLVPESEAGLSRLGWWRVNMDTGETLGMLSDGRGSVVTDYLVKFSGAISQAFLVAGLMGCLAEAHESGHKPGGLRRAACCVGANFAFYGIGWLGGNVVAGTSVFKQAVNLGLNAKEYLAGAALLWDGVSTRLNLPSCN